VWTQNEVDTVSASVSSEALPVGLDHVDQRHRSFAQLRREPRDGGKLRIVLERIEAVGREHTATLGIARNLGRGQRPGRPELGFGNRHARPSMRNLLEKP